MDAKAIIRKKLRVLVCAIVSLVALGSAPAALALDKVTFQDFYSSSGGGTYLIVGTGTRQNDCCLYFISKPTPLMMQAINMAYQMGTAVVAFGGSNGSSFTSFNLDRSADYDLIQPGAPYSISISNQSAPYGYGGYDASASHARIKYRTGDPCSANGTCFDSQIYIYGASGYEAFYSVQSAVLGGFATGKYSGVARNAINPTGYTRNNWIP